MLAMFGYMDVLIVLKWLTDYRGMEHQAPSIIQVMIGMFLDGGALPEGTKPIFGEGKTQATVSFALVIVVIVCVPIIQVMIGMFLDGGALPEGTKPIFGE